MDTAEGIFERVRSNSRLAIGAVVGALLVVAWIGWAIHVTSDHGARAGLGVVIAWPAMLAALALISLPFIGGYLLIKRRSPSEDEGGAATAEAEAPDADDQPDEEPEGSAEQEGSEDEDEDEDSDEDEDEDEDEGEESEDDDESDEDEGSEPDAEASSAS